MFIMVQQGLLSSTLCNRLSAYLSHSTVEYYTCHALLLVRYLSILYWKVLLLAMCHAVQYARCLFAALYSIVGNGIVFVIRTVGYGYRYKGWCLSCFCTLCTGTGLIYLSYCTVGMVSFVRYSWYLVNLIFFSGSGSGFDVIFGFRIQIRIRHVFKRHISFSALPFFILINFLSRKWRTLVII